MCLSGDVSAICAHPTLRVNALDGVALAGGRGVLFYRSWLVAQYRSSVAPVHSLTKQVLTTSKMARSVFFCSLAVLLAVVELGSCIKCYQCNSQQDPMCGDPFKAQKHLVDCINQDTVSYNQVSLRGFLPPEVFQSVVGAPRYCHKITTKSGTIVRTCLDVNPGDMNQTCRLLDNLSKMTGTEAGKDVTHCSVCDKDGCNGAGTMSISFPLATLALIITYLYCKQ